MVTKEGTKQEKTKKTKGIRIREERKKENNKRFFWNNKPSYFLYHIGYICCTNPRSYRI